LPQPPHLFLDTTIFIDSLVPRRSKWYPCSDLLLNKIRDGTYKGWTVDYVLSELLGNLKGELQNHRHLGHIPKEVLSGQDILGLTQTIEGVKRMPNLEISKARAIEQKEIYEKVKTLCIETKDAPILISTLEVQERLKQLGCPIFLITRDERFMIRARKEILTAHPSKFIVKCPNECLSKNTCKHRK
jgi:hypothetical protein